MQATTLIPIDSDPLLPAALAALGFEVKANVHLFPDANTTAAHKSVTWNCSEHTPDRNYNGGELVPAAQSGSIYRTNPNHPLVAGLLALQTRQILGRWIRGEIAKPHIVLLPGSKFGRAVAPSTRSQNADITTHLAGANAAMTLDHAAAAITVGHGLAGITNGQCDITSRGAFWQDVNAGMLAAAAARIERDPRSASIIPLPGYAPGEHPFLYALCAIKQARALQAIAEEKDPTLHLQSKAGKVALVSQSIMEGPHTFKEHVHKHIR